MCVLSYTFKTGILAVIADGISLDLRLFDSTASLYSVLHGGIADITEVNVIRTVTLVDLIKLAEKWVVELKRTAFAGIHYLTHLVTLPLIRTRFQETSAAISATALSMFRELGKHCDCDWGPDIDDIVAGYCDVENPKPVRCDTEEINLVLNRKRKQHSHGAEEGPQRQRARCTLEEVAAHPCYGVFYMDLTLAEEGPQRQLARCTLEEVAAL
jgi:hypothetical protein